ncbi:MAG: hypothetical protein ACI4JE_07105 [Ruminococcus sp.]
MDHYFACVLTEEELKKYVKTHKHISSTLYNLSELDTDEFIELLSFFLYESTAGYMPWRYVGIDYTMLMYELDPKRFLEYFTMAFSKAYKDINDTDYYDDFYDLEGWLRILDIDVYRQFMKISSESKYEDVRTDALQWLNTPPQIDTDSAYYKYHIAEYAEFKRKIDIAKNN